MTFEDTRREMMSKLLTMLMAGAMALTLGGLAAAADKDYDDQQTQNKPADPAAGGTAATPPAMSEKEKGSATDPAAGGATTSQSEQEYLAALKKCEPLTGADKTKCVDAAKKKHGQM
jgi:hypothetical protein